MAQGNQFAVTLDANGSARFFRLHSVRTLTQVAETSPAPGEAGVAVTRETILRFNAPLATNSVITVDKFFAGFGGRAG